MNRNKSLFVLMIVSSFSFIGLNNHAEELKVCHWRSLSAPEAVIVINSVSSIGIISGDLIYNGRKIRQLLFGQPNGYGSRWWAFEGVDGKPIKGGHLLPFKGSYPLRGIKEGRAYVNSQRRVLLVGLGSSIYYSDLRKDIDLIIASEGFWQLGKGCSFPGRD